LGLLLGTPFITPWCRLTYAKRRKNCSIYGLFFVGCVNEGIKLRRRAASSADCCVAFGVRVSPTPPSPCAQPRLALALRAPLGLGSVFHVPPPCSRPPAERQLGIMDITSEYSVAAPALMAGALSFVFIAFLYTKLAKFETGADIGVPVLDELSLQVKSGAIAFLKTEYTYLCVFVVALAATLFGLFAATDSVTVALAISLSFVFGASLSAGAGWWGMPAG